MKRPHVLLMLLLLAGPLCALAEDEGVPLPIELPQPSFGGTPLDYWSEHLEPPNYRLRKPFLAPEGTANLAPEAEVTASAEPLNGKLEAVTDGQKGFEEAYIVELPAGPQWVQLDLGAPAKVHAVVVWHFHAADRVYFDLVVQLSDDPEFKKDRTALFNNDYDNTLKQDAGEDPEYIENFQGRLIPGKGTAARFVRLWSNGNTSDDKNHYIEVEVWAEPAGAE